MALYKYVLSFVSGTCQLHDVRNMPVLFILAFPSHGSNTVNTKNIYYISELISKGTIKDGDNSDNFTM